MVNINKALIDSCHFVGDKNLQTELLKDKKIKESAESLLGQFRTTSDHRVYQLLGHSLQINKKSAPKIFGMFEDCQKALKLDKYPLNAFINSSQELNASCSFNNEEITIELNSGIIKAFNESELMFIIGHEFGHALFNHHSLPAYGIYQNVSLPPSKALKLMSWSRQAEISADRVGLICCQNINAASRALIKLSCGGLDESYISFDESDFQKQVIERKGIDDSDEVYFTHPLSPLRVSAIMDFWKSDSISSLSKVLKKNQISNSKVDENIFKFLEKMNPKIKTKKESKKKDNFILYAAYFVLVQDNLSENDSSLFLSNNDAYSKELDSLADICGRDEVNDFIEEYAKKIDLKELEKMIKKISDDFKKSRKGIKCAALEKIITVARADGELSNAEKKALYFVTSLIGINKDFVDQILKFLD
tara:strand:+ start:171 stop:1430 length:1260 start_codon:yes stop_codon:yes gene_type:complete